MYYFPLTEPISPEIMDSLLAQGFYRMRQTMFTTHFTVNDQDELIYVLWARVVLSDYQLPGRYYDIRRRCRRFQTVLTPAVINEEIEDLYRHYRDDVSFNAPLSVTEFLMGHEAKNFFPGQMWQVRDNGRLIAAGYFDEGTVSAAGILNFYHPDYRKFSLSKWMYFEAIRYACNTGKQFFYPGYVALDFTKFDYKLEAGTEYIEIWDPAMISWVPYCLSEHAMARQTERRG